MSLLKWPNFSRFQVSNEVLGEETEKRIKLLTERVDELLSKIDSKITYAETFPRSVYKLLWLLILAPLFWFVLLYYTSNAFLAVGEFQVWAVGSFGLVLSTAMVLWISSKSLATGVEDLEKRYRATTNEIEADVRRFIDPSVTYKKDEHELRLLLLGELELFAKDDSEKEIDIVGADRLRPNTDEMENMKEALSKGEKLSENQDVHYRYGRQFNVMLAAEKTLRRYIYLPKEPNELRHRTREYQNDFVRWLKEQEVFLTLNKQYTIVNTPRAPMYGAPKSMIFFRSMLVEVFFKRDGGGFIVTSRGSQAEASVVAATRQALIGDYLAAEDGPEPVIYNNRNVGAFTDYHARIMKGLAS